MITVEDILGGLASLVVSRRIKDEWSKNFIASVRTHVTNGNCLSTNQGAIVLKIAGKNVNDLHKVMKVQLADLDHYIQNPKYKISPYQSISIKREVRYLGTDKLAFRFKLDNMVVEDIKALKSHLDIVLSSPSFNKEYRLWIITVTPGNMEKVFNIIQRHRFDFDQDVLEYMTLCTNSKKVNSTFVMAEDEIYVNVCNNPILAFVVENVMKGQLL